MTDHYSEPVQDADQGRTAAFGGVRAVIHELDEIDSDNQCKGVIRDVYLFLDNELDPARRAVVEQHLIDCPPCLDETDVGHRLKSLLHRKCGGDTAPEVLRERLIAAISVQISVHDATPDATTSR